MITSLEPNQIFVFGSNTKGIHGRGAAKQAREMFGAKTGVGEGRTGQCYALPTLVAYRDNGWLRFAQRTEEDLVQSVGDFFAYCERNPDLVFLLTKVGCGLAGYDEEYMRSLFFHAPDNVVLPSDWEEYRNAYDD